MVWNNDKWLYIGTPCPNYTLHVDKRTRCAILLLEARPELIAMPRIRRRTLRRRWAAMKQRAFRRSTRDWTLPEHVIEYIRDFYYIRTRR